MAISSNLTTIQNIIYFEDAGYEADFISSENTSKWKVASFSEVIKLGIENPVVLSTFQSQYCCCDVYEWQYRIAKGIFPFCLIVLYFLACVYICLEAVLFQEP